ncbi:hypothetical protein HA402_008190 [Bradysia odoriphaga]|nr:hypothetical protein HA402_008190 [Bradysia odoriphaga]
MDECLRDIKATNHSIKLNTAKTIRQQLHNYRIKLAQQSNKFDDDNLAKEADDARKQDFVRWKWSASGVLKYLSLVIVVWIFFAIYSYLHNRCMLYGGSNCVHMNPFTFQNCNSNNYIF